MVAVRCGGERDPGHLLGVAAGADTLERHLPVQSLRQLALQDAQPGEGAAQGLEAAQPKAGAFVLVEDFGNAGFGGQGGQAVQRGRGIAVPRGDFRCCASKIPLGQDGLGGMAEIRPSRLMGDGLRHFGRLPTSR